MKGFSLPSAGSFKSSMPKVSLPKVSMPKVNVPDVPLTDVPGIGDVAKDLSGMGMELPTTGQLVGMGKDKLTEMKENIKSFKMPSGAELKEMGKAKIEDVKGQISDLKDTINNVKSNGVSGLIPQEYQNIGISADSIKGMIKGGK